MPGTNGRYGSWKQDCENGPKRGGGFRASIQIASIWHPRPRHETAISFSPFGEHRKKLSYNCAMKRDC
jgi:hypothetical protein